ncbi:MAG: hypothetical protein RLZ97_2057, partial [Verrucomicrobiota bacterium]
LPHSPAAESLHIIVEVASEDLVLGPDRWDDGRVLIQWQSQDGRQHLDPVISSRGTHRTDPTALVIPSQIGPATATLRIEHLGSSGTFRILRFEATPVKQRTWWKSAAVGTAGLWWAFGFGFCLRRPKVGILRSALASSVWLAALLALVMPGPWTNFRPVMGAFALGPDPAPVVDTTGNTATSGPQNKNPLPQNPQQDAGRVTIKGNWIIQIKMALTQLRPLLHAALFFGPTLIIGILAGRRTAVLLTSSLAIMVEAMQVLFGYGFDLVDIADLTTDAIGIAFAFWILKKFSCRWSWLEPSEPAPPAIPHRA